MAIFGNLAVVGTSQVPNLELAGLFSPAVRTLFMVVIVMAIYTTACPMAWGFCGKIAKDEKSTKYRVCILALTIVGMVCSYLFPLSTLINFMYGISGYVGAVVSVGMIISKRKSKKDLDASK